MCGITGIYYLNGRQVEKELLSHITQKLSHRGPDDEGIFIDGSIGFGHRRLMILDLSPRGHQPMSNEDRTLWVTYNGEIYNFRQLRTTLEGLGHRFISNTDTEVLLHSYQQWGADCLGRLNGMFAFAIWDKNARMLFIARDRLGKKPLYYYFSPQKFLFASEIKAILEDPDVRREIDHQGMANYFAFGHSIAPDTMYKGIKKLLPGHCAIVAGGEMTIKKYWELPEAQSGEDRGEKYYEEKIIELLEDSVRKRLVSDAPLGVFLSGGMDSSSIVAMMSRIGERKIKTFSLGFGQGGKEFNELGDARLVAKFFSTEHHEAVLEENDLLSVMDALVFHFDEPFGDAANFPVFLISKFAREHVKAVLTGEGGDEIFGGYRRYVIERHLASLLVLRKIFSSRAAQQYISILPGLRRLKQISRTLPIQDDTRRQADWLICFSDDMRARLFSKNFLPENIDVLYRYREVAGSFKARGRLENIMLLDQKILLPDDYLEKIDKATMAWGMEARAPFLDYRLVEFANCIPPRYKINGLTTKHLLRKAMSPFLPARTLSKGKHGFSVPTAIWFRGRLKDYMWQVLSDPKTRSRGYFNFQYVDNLYRQYQEGNQPFGYHLWLMLNFELWHRQFIDNTK